MLLNKICDIDCIQGMKQLNNDTINCLITDPPYFLMRSEFIQNIKTFDEYVVWYEEWIKQASRVLKPTGSMYVFIPVHHFAEIHLLIKKYFVGKQIISWIKPNTIIRQFKTKNWFPKTEFVGFYTKDEKNYTWNYPYKKFGVQQSCNFIYHSVIRKNMKEGVEHSTQKPLDIVKKFIYASSNENDLVFDPFLGSGTTAVACKQLGRNFIGFEINPDYVKIARERLNKINDSDIEKYF